PRIRRAHRPQPADRRPHSDRGPPGAHFQSWQGAARQGERLRRVAVVRRSYIAIRSMGTRLFIGNLSYNVTEQELREAFTGEGIELRNVRVALDRETGRPRGFAFVETSTDDGAKASIEKLSGRILQGRPIIVEEAKDKPPGPRPAGGFGGAPRPRGFAGHPP